MAPKANLTKSTNIATTAREIDFVSRFSANWQGLREIAGISRFIEKPNGTMLYTKTATVTLGTSPAEGDEIPYSLASVTATPVGPLTIEKYGKGVSVEAIADHGYDDAVARTDAAFLNELQGNVMDDFYTFALTGTGNAGSGTFQAGLAKARGVVLNYFKDNKLGVTATVAFVNIGDFFTYLGTADISTQTMFGLTYIQNFMGYSAVFLCSDGEIPSGKIVATAVDNIVCYYINPANSEFARAGLEFTVDGELPLIGFHTEGNYHTAVSENTALLGMKLFAEYLDGIAIATVTP